MAEETPEESEKDIKKKAFPLEGDGGTSFDCLVGFFFLFLFLDVLFFQGIALVTCLLLGAIQDVGYPVLFL